LLSRRNDIASDQLEGSRLMANILRALHPDSHAAVQALVRDADLELIPFKSAGEKLAAVPEGTTITVTCSVKLGLQRTLDFTALAVGAGYRVVPRLAARQVTDVAALQAFVGRLDALGVTDLYVIGGDAPEPAGPFNSAVELLEALSQIEHGIRTIGVACYPEGHPLIPDPLWRRRCASPSPMPTTWSASSASTTKPSAAGCRGSGERASPFRSISGWPPRCSSASSQSSR
jgi:hypothetical protein